MSWLSTEPSTCRKLHNYSHVSIYFTWICTWSPNSCCSLWDWQAREHSERIDANQGTSLKPITNFHIINSSSFFGLTISLLFSQMLLSSCGTASTEMMTKMSYWDCWGIKLLYETAVPSLTLLVLGSFFFLRIISRCTRLFCLKELVTCVRYDLQGDTGCGGISWVKAATFGVPFWVQSTRSWRSWDGF